MKGLLIGALVFSTLTSSHVQINGGSIVAFTSTPSGLVMAADSRSTHKIRPGLPDDNTCKIAAFKPNHVVFAATGLTSFVTNGDKNAPPGWNVIEDAKAAVIRKWDGPAPATALDAVNVISYQWEQITIRHWSDTLRLRPDLFNRVTADEAFKASGSVLTLGIFAIAYQGTVASVVSAIKYDNGSFSVSHPSTGCTLMCVMGAGDVYSKHEDEWTMSPDQMGGADPMSRAIGVVKITISEDQTGLVGGPVDALELLNDGTINWKQRKNNCPESQD